MMMKLKSFAKGLDSYGIPLQFTYNQKRTFTSYFGALITIFAKLGVIVYLGIILNQVFQKKLVTITTYEYYKDYFIESPQFVLQRENFDMAVRMVYQSGPNPELAQELDTYFTINFYTFEVAFLSSNQNASEVFKAQGYSSKFTKIERIRCPENRYGNETIGRGPNFTDYWCPKDIKDLVIQGTASSIAKTMFMMAVEPCNQVDLDMISPGKQCKSITEINDQMKYLQVWVNVRSQYFDVTEFDKNPIKHLQKKWVVQVPTNTMEYSFFKISRNIAQRQDKIFPLSFSNEYIEENFYQVESDYEVLLDLDASMRFQSGCFFLQDETIKVRKRSVFTLIDAFSKVGGVLGLVGTISFFITSFFQHGLFINSLFKKLYFMKPKYQTQGEDKISLLINKSNISFTIVDQILMKCRKKTHPKKQLFQKYVRYLRQELDIQSYILSLRKVNFLVDVILSKDQKKLMKYFLQHTTNNKYRDDDISQVLSDQGNNLEREYKIVKKCIDRCKQTQKDDKVSQNLLKMIYHQDGEEESDWLTGGRFVSPIKQLDKFKQTQLSQQKLNDTAYQSYKAKGAETPDLSHGFNQFKSDMTTKTIKSKKTSSLQQDQIFNKNGNSEEASINIKPVKNQKKAMKDKKIRNYDVKMRLKNKSQELDSSKRKLNDVDDEKVDIFNP